MRSVIKFALVFFVVVMGSRPALAFAELLQTGFLVVAPDRGFLGNQEILAVFEDFKKSYPAALALVGRDYNGIGSEYSSYLSRAMGELKQAGITDIVAIPLFPSKADSVLQKVIRHMPAYTAGTRLSWAPPMAESYLIRQILLERVETLSQEPENERLILLGVGATDEASEAAMKTDVEGFLAYITQRKRFKESQALVYYDRDAQGATEKNKAVDTLIMRAAAKKGPTLLLLAALGPKFDHRMALAAWIGQKFKDLNVVYREEDLMPHPNVLLWLKKTANQYVPPSRAEIGIAIMPHGATQPWNDAVEQAIAPLKSRYRIEMAYGMGDPAIIQQAVSRLEQQGIRRIVFVRMYALAHHMKNTTDYILGLTDVLGTQGHDHETIPPAQVRSAAVFSSFGGYEEDPGIAEVLHERIMEISKDPGRETVILLAHGEKSDEGDAKWISVMNGHIERLRKDPHCAKLRAIHAMTLREDWPEKREKAVSKLRELIEQGNKSGQVLLISNRLYGAGPYRKLLDGNAYVMNEKGFAPHPNLTRWLENGIERAMREMTDGVRP